LENLTFLELFACNLNVRLNLPPGAIGSCYSISAVTFFYEQGEAALSKVKNMVLGDKLWEGKGKSAGPNYIKDVGMEGVTSMYAWTAQLKGMGKAKGVDVNLNVTAFSTSPPKGIAKAKDQGMLMTMTGDMAVVKGLDLMKMTMPPGKPSSVGLWTFMTMSEKLGWLNEVIAVVTFEAQDPMWMEFNITITEWK
jgi:hypothetical protein